MDDQRVLRVLHGDMHNLPPMNSQIVRIFTSSTFTDTVQERNSLIENVYPKLQQYCRSRYGLEFQVVDMRWGVRDEATDDHQTSNLCLQEIQNCQQLSAGPNFVAFLGQRHGYRPFPPTIASSEFNILIGELESSGTNHAVLKDWFKEDLNVSPPVFILQPISSRIPDFLSEDRERKMAAKKEWERAFGEMQTLLRKAVISAHQQGKIGDDVKDKYFMSVTEHEITKGILKSPGNPDVECLCFIRVIEDIMSHLSHDKAWRFIDMMGSKVDEEAQQKLSELRDDKMAKAVKNLHRLKVKWKEICGGANEEKKNYLDLFSDMFYKAVIKMIDKGITFNQRLSEDVVYMEVLQHLYMAKDRCELFHGRQDILDSIKNCLSKRSNKPVVIVGSSGCGKTSVMSKCAMCIPEWFSASGKPVVILRLLGTTPSSTGVLQLLRSLTLLIASIYDVQDFIPGEDISSLIRDFHQLLEQATAEKPMYILLDSLDQLSAKSNAFKLTWLPRELPSYVQLLVSTLPDRHGIADVLRKRYNSSDFMDIPQLGGTTSTGILDAWLESKNRKLTNKQYEIVKNAFNGCSLALYVKLMVDKVLTWNSYFDVSSLTLPSTIRESINQLFDQLKRKFGVTFLMHALGYLTASRSGLSEIELEDLLSLDDKVLTDVFQYHVPPVRRIPQLLWLRLKGEIFSYLVTREADGVRVIYWYHRQFIEAAASYFLSDKDHQAFLHKTMVEYFSGMYHGKEKVFQYNEYHMKKLGLESPESKADRKVSAQPLVFEMNEPEILDQDTTVHYNSRKLMNLPYHIHHSGNVAECDMALRLECLYNFNFLKAKLKACSAQSILNDFELLHDPDQCDSWLKNIFRLRKTSLDKEPSTLPIEIAGTLLPVSPVKPYLKDLVNDCYYKGVKINAFLPRLLCYPMPGGSLVHEIEHQELSSKEKSLVLTTNPVVLASLTQDTNTLVLWDIQSGDVIEEVKLWLKSQPKFNVLATNTAGEKIICGCAFQIMENPIAIYDVAAEELTVRKLSKIYQKIGFTDDFEIGLMDSKIFVNVKGKEADCFDLEGNHLLSFDIQAAEMHLYYQLEGGENQVAFILKGNMNVVWFKDGERKTHSLIETSSLVPYKITLHDNAKDVFALHKEDGKVFCYQRSIEQNDEWELKGTIDLNDEFNFYSLGTPHDISVSGPYIILYAAKGLSLWKYAKQRLFNEFEFPEMVMPREEKVTSYAAQVTSDKRLLLCAYHRYIIVWDLVHGRLRQAIKAMTVPITTFLCSPCQGDLLNSDVIVTATSKHRNIKIWDSSRADSVTHQPLMLNAACLHGRLAENSNRMILRSHDVHDVRILDGKKGQFISHPAQNYESTEPLISPDGQYAVVRDFQTAPVIRVFNTDDGKLVQKMPIETMYLKRYAISQTSKYIATHSELSPTEEVETIIWDIKTGQKIKKMKAEQGGIKQLFFMCNDKYLVTLQQYPFIQYDQDSVMHVYNIKSGKEVNTFSDIRRDTSLMAIPKSENVHAIMSSYSGKTQNSVLIGVASGTIQITHEVPITTRWIYTISQDGKTAINPELHVINITTGDILFDISQHNIPPVEKIQIQSFPQVSPDGQFVVWTNQAEGILYVAKIRDQKIIGTCYTHGSPVNIFITHDNIAVCTTYEGIIMLLNIIDIGDDNSGNQVTSLIDYIEGPDGPLWRNIGNSEQVPLVSNKAQSCTCSIL